MYLRCGTGDRPRAWVDWLLWAEYRYNTSFHTSLHATPFEVVYGRPPPAILPYRPGTARTEAADALLRSRDEMLAEVRQRLIQAQQLAKKYYDANHREVEFDVSAWVWLRLLHRTAQSLDPVPSTSSGHDGLVRSACWNASVASLIVFSYPPARACMMSSTSAC